MPLLDHFRPPLGHARPWEGFFSGWAVAITGSLNAAMPGGYFAAPNIDFRIAADLAAVREPGSEWPDEFDPPRRLTPGAPTATVPFAVASDEVEVRFFDSGAALIGVIELVSPAHKDCPATRDGFNARCLTYLKSGVGVLVVDVVTTESADLHAELMRRINPDLPAAPIRSLAATSYRPDPGRLEFWRELLAVGGVLPTMPLWLKTGPCLPVDLEATYQQARLNLRIGDQWG